MEFESDPKCRLYIGNLSYNITENDVKDMFNLAGLVKDVYLPRIYKTRKHKGYGFIEMATPEDAMKAITTFHDQPDIYDRKMVVRFADIRRSSEEQAERRNNAKQKYYGEKN
jgi:RNA recognition motif-containing protein